jgi:hypothetical protein
LGEGHEPRSLLMMYFKVERLSREVRAMAVPGGSEEVMLDLGIRQTKKLTDMAQQILANTPKAKL